MKNMMKGKYKKHKIALIHQQRVVRDSNDEGEEQTTKMVQRETKNKTKHALNCEM